MAIMDNLMKRRGMMFEPVEARVAEMVLLCFLRRSKRRALYIHQYRGFK